MKECPFFNSEELLEMKENNKNLNRLLNEVMAERDKYKSLWTSHRDRVDSD